MTAHSELFRERQAICPESILITNGDSISAIAAGTACIAVVSDSGVSCVDLSGALLAPALKTNLSSVPQLVRQGLMVTFQNNAVVVLDKQQRILAGGVKEHSLFQLVQPPTADYSFGAPIYAFAALSASSLNTWQQRFIATELDSVRKVYNIKILHRDSPRQCQKGLLCLGGQGPPYCCDMALMRYWSPEYCDWRVALVTDVGEQVCTVLDIFFSYFYAFY
jgi:hypothetical protein